MSALPLQHHTIEHCNGESEQKQFWKERKTKCNLESFQVEEAILRQKQSSRLKIMTDAVNTKQFNTKQLNCVRGQHIPVQVFIALVTLILTP